MAFFKTDDERLKEAENKILDKREFKGKVGSTNTGYTFAEGFRNADKVKFNPSKFKIYDDKMMIERHRSFINFSDIKEIFQETKKEALIILNSDDVIPIQAKDYHSWDIINFKAFLNILNKLIEENKTNIPNAKSNENITAGSLESEDKFDKLIKLGEMYDKGLLSDEEFVSLKQELLSGNNEDTPSPSEDNDETSKLTCDNCGTEVSNDDVFCNECGTKIN